MLSWDCSRLRLTQSYRIARDRSPMPDARRITGRRDAPDYVEVLGLGEHHLLRLQSAPRGTELDPHLRRLLVLRALGGFAHLDLKPMEHRPGVPGEEVA